MKKLLLAIVAGTFMISCGEGEVSGSSNVTYKWNEFVTEYDKDHDFFDGNKKWDGKEVTLEGKIEGLSNSTDIDGNETIQICFGKDGDNLFAKCKIKAHFPVDKEADLEGARESGETITFKGKIEDKSFDEITVKGCVMV